ncbi:MAG: hypothetical protein WBW16_09090 [Bacteroidota bacterium]
MKRSVGALLVCFSILAAMLQFSGCSSSIEIASRKADHPIRIDGKDDEWENNLAYLKEKKLALGFCDDGSSLYLCMTTNDRWTRQQVLGTGLTVWLDSTGSEEKTVGIHFPLGAMGQEEPMDRERPTMDQGEWQGPQEMQGMVEKLNGQMEIIGPERDQHRRLLLPTSEGYNAKVDLHEGKLVYELQIPLMKTGEKGILGVGLETPELDKNKMPQPPGGEGPGGMPPGGGGMPPGGGPPGGEMGRGGPSGGGMGPGGGSRPSLPEALNVWVQVRLSSSVKAAE